MIVRLLHIPTAAAAAAAADDDDDDDDEKLAMTQPVSDAAGSNDSCRRQWRSVATTDTSVSTPSPSNRRRPPRR